MNATHNPPVWAVLGRLVWMMLGPPAMLQAASAIVMSGNGWLTVQDFAFLGVVAAMLISRWLEHLGGQPMTSTGEPATAADFNRYLMLTAAIGLLVWIIANIFGNHLL